ncbi:uncharacterized protein TNCV_3912081 [Trichonephila clavipes]|nr:uncharacterized protein TNCV_3912081 [Trichonephila clavipes]
MYLEDFKNKIEFHYHPVVKRVNIKTKGHAKIYLAAGVSELLGGFEPGEIKGKVESPYIADPNASFPFIYVYCDLVEPQIVGDIQSPLLKVVKVEGKDEVVNSHYTRPHYVPVIRQHFQPIELNLRLHSGDLVLFERGRVIAVIHFRMRQIV